MATAFQNKSSVPASAARRSGEIFSLIKDSLQLMKEKGMDRLVLSVSPMPRDMELVNRLQGGWTDMKQSCFRYYPYDILTKAELEFVDKHAPHQVISIVLGDADKYYGRNYSGDGIEIANRTNLSWMMPELKKSAAQRFGTEFICYLDEAGLQNVAAKLADSHPDLTAAMLKENVDEAIAEYQSITKKLIAASGVPSALENLEHARLKDFPDAIKQWLGEAIASLMRA